MGQFYTTQQVSRALSVSQDTVRTWAARGFLPSVRIGPAGRLRFPAEGVAEAIRAKTARPAAQAAGK